MRKLTFRLLTGLTIISTMNMELANAASNSPETKQAGRVIARNAEQTNKVLHPKKRRVRKNKNAALNLKVANKKGKGRAARKGLAVKKRLALRKQGARGAKLIGGRKGHHHRARANHQDNGAVARVINKAVNNKAIVEAAKKVVNVVTSPTSAPAATPVVQFTQPVTSTLNNKKENEPAKILSAAKTTETPESAKNEGINSQNNVAKFSAEEGKTKLMGTSNDKSSVDAKLDKLTKDRAGIKQIAEDAEEDGKKGNTEAKIFVERLKKIKPDLDDETKRGLGKPQLYLLGLSEEVSDPSIDNLSITEFIAVIKEEILPTINKAIIEATNYSDNNNEISVAIDSDYEVKKLLIDLKYLTKGTNTATAGNPTPANNTSPTTANPATAVTSTSPVNSSTTANPATTVTSINPATDTITEATKLYVDTYNKLDKVAQSIANIIVGKSNDIKDVDILIKSVEELSNTLVDKLSKLRSNAAINTTLAQPTNVVQGPLSREASLIAEDNPSKLNTAIKDADNVIADLDETKVTVGEARKLVSSLEKLGFEGAEPLYNHIFANTNTKAELKNMDLDQMKSATKKFTQAIRDKLQSLKGSPTNLSNPATSVQTIAAAKDLKDINLVDSDKASALKIIRDSKKASAELETEAKSTATSTANTVVTATNNTTTNTTTAGTTTPATPGTTTPATPTTTASKAISDLNKIFPSATDNLKELLKVVCKGYIKDQASNVELNAELTPDERTQLITILKETLPKAIESKLLDLEQSLVGEELKGYNEVAKINTKIAELQLQYAARLHSINDDIARLTAAHNAFITGALYSDANDQTSNPVRAKRTILAFENLKAAHAKIIESYNDNAGLADLASPFDTAQSNTMTPQEAAAGLLALERQINSGVAKLNDYRATVARDQQATLARFITKAKLLSTEDATKTRATPVRAEIKRVEGEQQTLKTFAANLDGINNQNKLAVLTTFIADYNRQIADPRRVSIANQLPATAFDFEDKFTNFVLEPNAAGDLSLRSLALNQQIVPANNDDINDARITALKTAIKEADKALDQQKASYESKIKEIEDHIAKPLDHLAQNIQFRNEVAKMSLTVFNDTADTVVSDIRKHIKSIREFADDMLKSLGSSKHLYSAMLNTLKAPVRNPNNPLVAPVDVDNVDADHLRDELNRQKDVLTALHTQVNNEIMLPALAAAEPNQPVTQVARGELPVGLEMGGDLRLALLKMLSEANFPKDANEAVNAILGDAGITNMQTLLAAFRTQRDRLIPLFKDSEPVKNFLVACSGLDAKDDASKKTLAEKIDAALISLQDKNNNSKAWDELITAISKINKVEEELSKAVKDNEYYTGNIAVVKKTYFNFARAEDLAIYRAALRVIPDDLGDYLDVDGNNVGRIVGDYNATLANLPENVKGQLSLKLEEYNVAGDDNLAVDFAIMRARLQQIIAVADIPAFFNAFFDDRVDHIGIPGLLDANNAGLRLQDKKLAKRFYKTILSVIDAAEDEIRELSGQNLDYFVGVTQLTEHQADKFENLRPILIKALTTLRDEDVYRTVNPTFLAGNYDLLLTAAGLFPNPTERDTLPTVLDAGSTNLVRIRKGVQAKLAMIETHINALNDRIEALRVQAVGAN